MKESVDKSPIVPNQVYRNLDELLLREALNYLVVYHDSLKTEKPPKLQRLIIAMQNKLLEVIDNEPKQVGVKSKEDILRKHLKANDFVCVNSVCLNAMEEYANQFKSAGKWVQEEEAPTFSLDDMLDCWDDANRPEPYVPKDSYGLYDPYPRKVKYFKEKFNIDLNPSEPTKEETKP